MSDLFFKTREETQAWLDEMGVVRHTIRDDLTVDVESSVDIAYQDLSHIPVKFGVVSGNFDCSGNHLANLAGSPRQCKGFWCNGNQLISLDGAPDKCVDMACGGNRLTSLNKIPAGCYLISCEANPDLHDVSKVPDGSELFCDRDIIAKNQAARQLAAFDPGNTNDSGSVLQRKSSRAL